MLLIFVVGDVLGAGIYALVGEVGAEVGGAIWTAFLAALKEGESILLAIMGGASLALYALIG
jgi:hypothetical protein